MTLPSFSTLVLAAGQGTRMKSRLPKVLHPVAGRPLVAWAVHASQNAGAGECVVVLGHEAEAVRAELSSRFGDYARVAIQPQQNGTGHAVLCAMPSVTLREGYVVVLYGDCPLVHEGVVTSLVEAAVAKRATLAMLVGTLADPTGYGRILRDNDGNVSAIREHKDCSPAEREITEVNPGVYCIDVAFLREAITRLDSNNAQGELYLTDVVAQAAVQGHVVALPWDMQDLRGVNDRAELSEIEAIMRHRIARAHAKRGVTVRDFGSAYIDADVTIDEDARIEANVTLRRGTKVGRGAVIDVGCVLDNVVVHAGAHMKPYSVATDSEVGKSAHVGPFSHLRPKSKLGEGAHVGNFVETKATTLGARSKANHLAYLGDGLVGDDVNVGAGTIFCNYDGFQKHVTVLEDGAFIGSDSQLVAPVRVGKGAYVGTGTTVTKDVPDGALAIGRARQENKDGYGTRLRAQLKAKAGK